MVVCVVPNGVPMTPTLNTRRPGGKRRWLQGGSFHLKGGASLFLQGQAGNVGVLGYVNRP